ncbi:MAG: peroxiredoxin, partial [Candidatus Thermoplasmatota archaeon]|nr:peroxiredoxin [Candidatus Thermoplasmatota archaeon]
MVNVGDTAPAFTLRATDKREVSLSEYAGKTVILAFYPGAFTGVCDKEMCAFQDSMAELNASDAVVLGISVDSPWANAAFARTYNLEFELLSDLDRAAVKAYDATFTGLGG